jgi:hypothetical protein
LGKGDFILVPFPAAKIITDRLTGGATDEEEGDDSGGVIALKYPPLDKTVKEPVK